MRQKNFSCVGPVAIPTKLAIALAKDPLFFPLSMFQPLVLQCNNKLEGLSLLSLQPKLKSWDSSVRKSAAQAIAALFLRVTLTRQCELIQTLIQPSGNTGGLGFFLQNEFDLNMNTLNIIEKITPRLGRADFLSPQLIQWIYKKLNDHNVEVREKAWQATLSLAFRFPKQINEYFNSMDTDWVGDMFGFIFALCKGQEAQVNTIAAHQQPQAPNSTTSLSEKSGTLFSRCHKKMSLTQEEKDAMSDWDSFTNS